MHYIGWPPDQQQRQKKREREKKICKRCSGPDGALTGAIQRLITQPRSTIVKFNGILNTV